MAGCDITLGNLVLSTELLPQFGFRNDLKSSRLER